MKQTAVELSRYIVEIFATEEELNIINQSKLFKQERMYSEKDMKEIIYLTWLKCLDANGGDFIDNRNQILEKFKNK